MNLGEANQLIVDFLNESGIEHEITDTRDGWHRFRVRTRFDNRRTLTVVRAALMETFKWYPDVVFSECFADEVDAYKMFSIKLENRMRRIKSPISPRNNLARIIQNLCNSNGALCHSEVKDTWQYLIIEVKNDIPAYKRLAVWLYGEAVEQSRMYREVTISQIHYSETDCVINMAIRLPTLLFNGVEHE